MSTPGQPAESDSLPSKDELERRKLAKVLGRGRKKIAR